MTLFKKITITVLCVIMYLGVGFASQLTIIPVSIRNMLMSLQFVIVGALLLWLLIFAVRSTWKNRRLESFLLLILSVLISSIFIPVYIRMSFHFGNLALTELRGKSQETKNLQEHRDSEGDSSLITEIGNKKDYDQLFANNKDSLVVIKVSAVWCPPCQQLAPLYREIASEFNDRAKFAEIDFDKFDDKSAIMVNSLPTILFYKNGNEVSRSVGFKTKLQLIAILQELV